ncbi:hypothetical protein [Pseudooceanicola algae]|uniref:DUF2059 domain-containing protein n=1 Tax=Pseudooceanicola algae TaxID=1537215 RepID=A0A418SE31_9RHOB|nr:hypothetical protein [Pseudooceanicola algae]QPM89606.1 hypothetical protein PSAL_008280 [Pseudooceanicola algae]
MMIDRPLQTEAQLQAPRKAVATPLSAARDRARGMLASAVMALAAAVLLVANAFPARAASETEVRDFLQVTGFDVALAGITDSAASGPAMLGMEESDFVTTWRVLTREVFDEEVIKDMGVEMIRDTITDSDLAMASGFYGGELGKRLVEAENSAQTMDGEDSMTQSAAALEDLLDEGADDRIALLDRLNRAVSTTTDGDSAVVEVQYRFLSAARDAGVITFQVSDDQMRQMLLEQSRQIREANQSYALANAAFTYRDFTNDEIETYAEALEDPAMQRVYELMNAVQSEITANRFELVAAKLEGVAPSTDL